MPEVLCAISKYKSLEELEEELLRFNFMEIHRDDLDPPIRRVLERDGNDSSKAPTQMQLVKALTSGLNYLPRNISFGMMTTNNGDREYVGVDRDELRVVWSNKEYVDKRRSRYQANPLPPEGQGRRDFVKKLMYEIIEQWSSTDPDAMGTSRARIYLHVADYSNIELPLARKLVDELLPTLEFVERVRADWDFYRILPAVMAKPTILIDVR